MHSVDNYYTWRSYSIAEHFVQYHLLDSNWALFRADLLSEAVAVLRSQIMHLG